MPNRQYLFTNHILKRTIKSIHQIDIIVLNKTIWQVFQVNA